MIWEDSTGVPAKVAGTTTHEFVELDPAFDLHRTAVHEAAHAVVAVRHDLWLKYATIIPSPDALGHCLYTVNPAPDPKYRLGKLRSLCAGGLGKLVFGVVPFQEIDLDDAGLDIDALGDSMSLRYTVKRIREVIDRAFRHTHEYMVETWGVLDDVRRVAMALVEQRTMTGGEVKAVMQGGAR